MNSARIAFFMKSELKLTIIKKKIIYIYFGTFLKGILRQKWHFFSDESARIIFFNMNSARIYFFMKRRSKFTLIQKKKFFSYPKFIFKGIFRSKITPFQRRISENRFFLKFFSENSFFIIEHSISCLKMRKKNFKLI